VALAAGVVAGLGHRAGLSGLYRRKPDDRPLADPSDHWGLFVGHGTQKLFGWFGGPGLDESEGMMDKAGPAPASPPCAAGHWDRGQRL